MFFIFILEVRLDECRDVAVDSGARNFFRDYDRDLDDIAAARERKSWKIFADVYVKLIFTAYIRSMALCGAIKIRCRLRVTCRKDVHFRSVQKHPNRNLHFCRARLQVGHRLSGYRRRH